jgi:hypothetical protein
VTGERDPEAQWVCRCRLPDGVIETSYWITQDAADQMESETESAYPGAACDVFPTGDAR